MKFVLVTGPMFSVHCDGCGVYKRAGDQSTITDFKEATNQAILIIPDNVYTYADSEAVKSYYCQECATKLSVEDPTRSVNQFFSDTAGKDIEPEHIPE